MTGIFNMEGTRTGARTLCLLLGLCIISAQDTQQCGSIGNVESETRAGERRDRRFYLDVNNPATCTGNITNWRVCYYGPNEVDDRGAYLATYAVYRRMGADSFERVSETFRAIRAVQSFTSKPVVDGVIQEGGFLCYDDSINVDASPFTIQVGDVLGACIFNPQDRDNVKTFQLNVVGDTGRRSPESLLEMNTDGCGTEWNSSLPSSILMNNLRNRNSRRLHIRANIAPLPPPLITTMATIPPLTTSDPSLAAVTTPRSTLSPDNQTVEMQDTESGLSDAATSVSGTEIPSSPRSGGLDLSAEAIVGLLIGILLSLVLTLAVVVIVLYLVKRRQTTAGRATKDKPLHGIDNLTYGEGMEGKVNKRTTEDKTETADTTLYELPVNSTPQNQNGHSVTDLAGSTYAVPNMYEYATFGPDKMESLGDHDVYYSPLDKATIISYSKLLEKNKQEDIYGNVEEYLAPATGESELYAQLKACAIKNISSRLIQINGHLGSGEFGSVESGFWKNGEKSVPVALKLLKEGSTEGDTVKFLQEAAIMAQFKHPNVVSLYGVVSSSEPLMLVVELIQKGDLRNYLHTLRPDPGELPAASLPQLLLSFSQQVALGMQYLSAKGFVHRDLAARNILVSNDNICKVTDFGMSRNLADETYYVSHGGVIPVKWTAPEAINYKKYSTASDVWSYGCVLYEIWSLGCKPFEGIPNAKVVRIVDLKKRLSPPPGCSRVVYELMIKCWNPLAADRPAFRQILLSLIDNPEGVLSIPQEDLETHQLAGVLGSVLEAGENMYRDLRDRYLETDGDYQEVN